MQGMRKASYTLVEVLAVIGVGLLLLSTTFSFFYKGRGVCLKCVEEVMLTRSASLLKQEWRTFLRQNGELLKAEPSKLSFKNGAEIIAGKESISFRSKTVDRRQTLPKGAEGTFSLEEGEGLPPCAVLHLEFGKAKNKERDFVRIVSAIGGSHEKTK